MAMMGIASAPIPARAQVKPHQATGVVATSAPAQVVILKKFGRNQVRWTFVVNPKTAFDGKAAKGARVRIFIMRKKGCASPTASRSSNQRPPARPLPRPPQRQRQKLPRLRRPRQSPRLRLPPKMAHTQIHRCAAW